MQSTAKAPRVIRGLCAAITATFAALVAHVAAGGDVPALTGLIAPLGLSAIAGVVLAGRRLSVVRLSLVVALSQMLFHQLFVLGAAHAHAAPAVGGLLPGGVTMWIGHLTAAAATVYFLYRGERVIHTLRGTAEHFVNWLRHRLDPLSEIAATPYCSQPLVATNATWPLQAQAHSKAHQRRGPPADLVHTLPS